MLYYDRIDIRKGTDLVRGINSKKCMICDYWSFNHGFEFQDSVCNGCLDLTILSVNISNISLLKISIIIVLFIALPNVKQLIY